MSWGIVVDRPKARQLLKVLNQFEPRYLSRGAFTFQAQLTRLLKRKGCHRFTLSSSGRAKEFGP